jgi:hypothetical protein
MDLKLTSIINSFNYLIFSCLNFKWGFKTSLRMLNIQFWLKNVFNSLHIRRMWLFAFNCKNRYKIKIKGLKTAFKLVLEHRNYKKVILTLK